MKKRTRRFGAVVVSALLWLTADASAQVTPVSDPAARVGGVPEHVILVSIDGLRPDAIDAFSAPTLRRLMTEGSHSLSAMTVVPSKTLPSHTSMLTGVGPDVHGITWNSYDESRLGYVAVPTVFELAHAAGLSTAAFVAKAKFRHLLDPSEIDYFEAPTSNAAHWMAPRTIERAANYLRHERPEFLFVHIGEPDYTGHTLGWMGAAYGWAVGQADAAVARLIEAADATYGAGEYLLIVTADHGGHERSHGSAEPVDRWIPWIAWGEGVSRSTELMPGIRTFDTAATVLWALGVATPPSWAGRPVTSAFEAPETPRPMTAAAPQAAAAP